MLDEKNKKTTERLPENDENQNTTLDEEKTEKKNFRFEEPEDCEEFGPYGRPYSF